MWRPASWAALGLIALLPVAAATAQEPAGEGARKSPFSSFVPVAKVPSWITAAVFTPDGRWLVATAQQADQGGPTALLLVPGLTVVREFPGFPDYPGSLDVSGDGRFLAAGGKMGFVGLWDLGSGKPLLFSLPRGNVVDLRVRFMPDPRRLYLEGGWFTGQVIDWSTGEPTPVVSTTQMVSASMFAVSPDGKTVAHEDQSLVVLHSLENGRLLWTQETTDSPKAVRAIAWSADGKRLAAVVGSHWKIWDIAAGREISSTPIEAGPGCRIVFTPELDFAVVAAGRYRRDGEPLRVWAAGRKDSVHDLRTDCPIITGLALSPDGKHLFAYGPQGAALLGAAD